MGNPRTSYGRAATQRQLVLSPGAVTLTPKGMMQLDGKSRDLVLRATNSFGFSGSPRCSDAPAFRRAASIISAQKCAYRAAGCARTGFEKLFWAGRRVPSQAGEQPGMPPLRAVVADGNAQSLPLPNQIVPGLSLSTSSGQAFTPRLLSTAASPRSPAP